MRLLLCCLLLVACGKPNPDACCTTSEDCLKYGFRGITPCSGDLVCNANGTCAVPQCAMTSDCNDPTLTCDIYGECIPLGSGSGSSSQYTLTVQIAGSGGGSVTSTPPGITCASGTCTGVFDTGTEVALGQTAATGSFLGWTSACRGTNACTVTLSSDQKVGAMFGIKGEVLWAKPVGAEGPDWGRGVVATTNGDVVATGQFAGTMTLDAITLQTGDPTIYGGYIAKFDGLTGKALWAKSFPVVELNEVATDGDALYVTGEYSGTVQIGTAILNSAGGADVFVAKLDATGDPLWAASIGGSGRDFPYGISTANGVVALVGYETSGITIGTTSYPASGTSENGFVAAFDAITGSVKWSRDFTASGVITDALATFAGSKLFVGGDFSGAIDFGAGAVSPISTDAFVAQYDIQTGALARIDHWGGASSAAQTTALTQDSLGNIVAAGSFGGSLSINGTMLTATGSYDVFLVDFTGSTNKWTQHWSTSSGALAYPTSIAMNASELVVVGDFCKGTIYIGTTLLTGVTCTVQNLLRTGLLARLRSDGMTFVGVHSLGTYGWAEAVARAPDDRIFVTGKFVAALREDTNVLISSAVGQSDAYVIAVAP